MSTGGTQRQAMSCLNGEKKIIHFTKWRSNTRPSRPRFKVVPLRQSLVYSKDLVYTIKHLKKYVFDYLTKSVCSTYENRNNHKFNYH